MKKPAGARPKPCAPKKEVGEAKDVIIRKAKAELFSSTGRERENLDDVVILELKHLKYLLSETIYAKDMESNKKTKYEDDYENRVVERMRKTLKTDATYSVSGQTRVAIWLTDFKWLIEKSKLAKEIFKR